MDLRKLLGTIVILVLIYWIFTQPSSAASSVESLGNTLTGWAQNVTVFFRQIAT